MRLTMLPLLGFVLLAGCSRPEPLGAGVLGARGTTVDSVRGGAPGSAGAAPLDGVLRPEPGNIWTEGLDTARQPAPPR